jgi:hypothetical protein
MVEGRQAPLFARSSWNPGGSWDDADRYRLQAEVDHLRRECQRLEREQLRLRQEKWDGDRALLACKSELSSMRFLDEMRGWFLSVIVPILGVTFVVLVVAASRH